jgi:phospholipid/cholesterol/gamma-HCH transport system permease protein
VFNALDFGDLIPATIKVSFGFAIGLVGCFKGYYCKKGTGVGVANSAVVYTSMLLFIIDFIAVFVTDIFYDLIMT